MINLVGLRQRRWIRLWAMDPSDSSKNHQLPAPTKEAQRPSTEDKRSGRASWTAINTTTGDGSFKSAKEAHLQHIEDEHNDDKTIEDTVESTDYLPRSRKRKVPASDQEASTPKPSNKRGTCKKRLLPKHNPYPRTSKCDGCGEFFKATHGLNVHKAMLNCNYKKYVDS